LGIVYNPYSEEKFEAVKDNGAFLNQNPIKVSTTKKLGNSLLATGFPYNIHKDPDTVLDLLKKMIVTVQGVRRPGSAAIDLCYVAAGRLDGFWEQNLMPWDTAAGNLIVIEAGGVVSDYDGNPYTPFKKSIIASNPHIHPQMVDVIKKVTMRL
jgi:myo-inositol-1(or 4)-monophosphatase